MQHETGEENKALRVENEMLPPLTTNLPSPKLNNPSAFFPNFHDASPVNKETLALAPRHGRRRLVPFPRRQPSSKSTTVTTARARVTVRTNPSPSDQTPLGKLCLKVSEQKDPPSFARELFDRHLDGSGAKGLRKEGLQKIFEDQGISASETEVMQILEALDTDGSGEVSFDEFINGLGADKARMLEWIQSTGFLAPLVERLPPMPVSELAKYFSSLSEAEIKNMLQSAVPEASALLWKKSQETCEEQQRLRELCSQHTSDKFGGTEGKYGTFEDFKLGLVDRIGPPSDKEDLVQEIMREHDAHPDQARVEVEEFPAHYGNEPTNSRIEYEIASKPDAGKTYPGQRGRGEGMKGEVKPLVFFLKIARVRKTPEKKEGGGMKDDAETKEEGERKKEEGEGKKDGEDHYDFESEDEDMWRLYFLKHHVVPKMFTKVEDRKLRTAVKGCKNLEEAFAVLRGRKLTAEDIMKRIADERDTIVQAQLRREEVLALRLYSGPMYKRYNQVLRDRKVFRGNNTYATTIHCLVSGVTKLARTSQVPDSRTLFRGMSGMKLPQQFWKRNAFNCFSGVDFGLLSTTTDPSVAVHYSGGGEKQLPCVWEISVGESNRGASMSWVSQYPDEEEILFPPMSLLEKTAEPRLSTSERGGTLVLPMSISVNSKSLTIDEHLAQKKTMVLNMTRLNIVDVERRLERCTVPRDWAFDSFSANIKKQLAALVARMEGRKAEDFNEGLGFKAALAEVLDTTTMAISHIEYAESDTQQGAYRMRELSLREGHRRWLGEKEGELRKLTEEGRAVEAQETAVYLCKKKGIVRTEGPQGLEETNELGETLLMSTALEAPHNVALVIQAGANVTARDGAGRTVLHHSCRDGRLEAVRAVLQVLGAKEKGTEDKEGETKAHGSDAADIIDAKDEEGKTALLEAAAGGHVECLKALLDNKADPSAGADKGGRTALMYAAKGGHSEVVGYLVEKGADVKAADKDGWTALMWAALNGHSEVVGYLVEKGADVKAANKDGNTALSLAAEKGHLDVVMKLAEAGADVIVGTNENGWTALVWAAFKGHSEVVGYLVEKGADVKAVTKRGKTALSLAAEEGHWDVVMKLAEAGADVNVGRDVDGRTALMYAAFKGHSEVVGYLVEKGADVKAANEDGNTALSLAAEKGHLDVVMKLAEAGADVNVGTNEDGWTALMYAAFKGHSEVVGYLVEKGADVKAANEDGRTALSLATEKGHEDVVKILKGAGA